MGNYNSGNRKDNKKTLTTDCTFIDSYQFEIYRSLDLIINSQYKQHVDFTYNERKRHGGKVKYFECPFCHVRVRFLYALNNRLACRTCQNLTYESSQKKNHFNFMAKMFTESGMNPRIVRSIFRPRKNSLY